MKPRTWKKMSNKAKKEYAIKLFESIRGQYIVGQALGVAIKTMAAIKPSYKREVSNIEDMEVLIEIFTFGKIGL